MKTYTLTLDDTTFYDPLLENVVNMLPDDMTKDAYLALDEFSGF